MLKRISIKKISKGNFVRKKSKKICIIIKKVIRSEVTLTHKTERPSDYIFQLFHTLSDRAYKKVICFTILLEILNTAESISRMNNFIS